MARIVLEHITPLHFYETVKMLKLAEHRIYITTDSIEIRFSVKTFETKEETQSRFDQLEHIEKFLNELKNSSVPMELDEFIKMYKFHSKNKVYSNSSYRLKNNQKSSGVL
ncbi:hypothetical protein JFL47_11430 [Haemophilus haemoglobinophilus]|nr:hypothetical protein [Canicola haemoglobinophilus]MBN6711825.1 hypothetical protein [Canicola haemoglobinophilus]